MHGDISFGRWAGRGFAWGKVKELTGGEDRPLHR